VKNQPNGRQSTRWYPTRLLQLVVCGVALVGSRAAAQEPADRIFADPIFSSERRGSPVETLEAATGERVREEGPDEIETDRDSFTPATTTAGRGRLIGESAYTFLDHRGVKEMHSFPELILRYGLAERVELRLGWNYEVGGAGNDVSGLDAGGDDVFANRPWSDSPASVTV
jgi:hypothetical protein